MFSETHQNWTVIDVTLLWVLQWYKQGGLPCQHVYMHLHQQSRVHFSDAQLRRIPEPLALQSCSSFADTSQESEDFAHPSSELPAVRWNQRARREPFKSPARTRGAQPSSAPSRALPAFRATRRRSDSQEIEGISGCQHRLNTRISGLHRHMLKVWCTAKPTAL